MTGEAAPAARFRAVSQRYGAVLALDRVSLDVPAGCLVGVIGPDGVGKSSLLAIAAGARRIHGGTVAVLGAEMTDAAARARICPRIAYMPQGLGKNLYPDLSVRENVDFFGRLFGQPRQVRRTRIAELLDATGLAPFPDRPAWQLSGGMRQKLGLCCALIHDPDLLILDEPTTGVDPLSRRQFWDLIARLRARHAGMSVIVATAYMEEAERFDWIVAVNRGRVLAAGSPAEIKRRAGKPDLEAAFIALLPEEQRAGHAALDIPPRGEAEGPPVIVARDLTRRFDGFAAVDHVSFTIERGEIFGFVGSNGCGKTTTMKMLTGLLPASAGEARLFGRPIDAADMRLRAHVGYMSQGFSLYSELSVRQNLELHARLFHLPPAPARARIARLVRRFGLEPYLDAAAAQLPLGIRQRLSLAVAVVHAPEVLILDEPTSGVDPLARDRFWELLVELSRRQGVTIFVSTHFMNEAARCDRIALMHAGKVLATGAPAELIVAQAAAGLEEAFVGYLEKATGAPPAPAPATTMPAVRRRDAAAPAFSLRRLFAYAIREALELWRDPVRLAFALAGTAFLMLVLGFGINTDVDHLSFAALDRDHTPASRAYIDELAASRYFDEKTPLKNYAELEKRLAGGRIEAAIEIPPGFGRDLKRGRPTQIGAWIDGAMPFRAETMRGYLEGVHQRFLADLAMREGQSAASVDPADIEIRFRYNQDFDSIYAMVPSTIALLLTLIPAILMALAIVREKETGSIVNLYVTPVSRIEFLLGKQLPCIVVALVNFALLFLMSQFLFAVPLKGSFAALLLGAVVYVTATTGLGMVISAFTRTQIAALFGTIILTIVIGTQFSGMLTPVSALSGGAYVMGRLFPMTYFLQIAVGAFTKGLSFAELSGNLLALAAFVPALTAASFLLLRKQER